MSQKPQDHAAEIRDTFELLGEWEDRYKFLIDLGRELPEMDANEKTDANKVKGCMSSVWLVAEPEQHNDDTIVHFKADSDAAIVKGLVAMLHKIYSGQSARDILDYDIEELFQSLDLGQHLSMGRRNGLAEMVQRIRQLAASAG